MCVHVCACVCVCVCACVSVCEGEGGKCVNNKIHCMQEAVPLDPFCKVADKQCYSHVTMATTLHSFGVPQKIRYM